MLKVEVFKIKNLDNKLPNYEKIFICYDSFELLEREFGIDINIINDLILEAKKEYTNRIRYTPEIKDIPVKIEKELNGYDNNIYLVKIIYKDENIIV